SLIRDEVRDDQVTRTRAEGICDAAQRAAGLTRQLLAYSGRGRFLTEPIELSRLVRDMSELLRLSIFKGVSLQFELADNLPAIEGDVSQIQQIVMNLVINGAEAIGSDNPGSVVVRTSTQEIDSTQIHRFAPV